MATTTMSDYVKKLGLFGIGIATLTKEKAEQIVGDFIKKGDINKEEGKAIVKELLEKSEEQRKDLIKRIDERTRETLKEKGVASKKDIKRLEERIEKLEAHVKKLEGKKGKK